MDIQKRIGILATDIGMCRFVALITLCGYRVRYPQSKNSTSSLMALGAEFKIVKLFHKLKMENSEIRSIYTHIFITAGCLVALHKYGFNLTAAVMVLYFLIFGSIAAVDFENKLIPNKLLIIGVILIIILYPFSDLGRAWPVNTAYLNTLLGSIAGFFIMVPVYVLSKGGFGAGDVKLGGLIGATLGLSHVLIGLCAGFICGGLVAIIIWTINRKPSGSTFAYGPNMIVGLLVTLFGFNGWMFEFFKPF